VNHDQHPIPDPGIETAEQRALATRESLFPGQTVVHDDTPLWLAWETAQQAWLDAKRRKSGGENTVNAYRTAARQFFDWSNTPPWGVSPALAQDWATHLCDERGLAESSVNQKLAALSSLYDFVQRRYVFRTPTGQQVALWPADRVNPFNTVERFKVSPFGRARFPSEDELQAILGVINTKCLRGKRDFALIFGIATTCRRDDEFRPLRWGDIQERDEGKYTFNYHPKGNKRETRTAVLPAWVYQSIVVYLKAAERWPPEDDEYVFAPLDPQRIRRIYPDREVETNKPISNTTANRVLKKYARRAGVDEDKAHLHGLRHAGARLRWRLQKEQGTADLLEIMSILGHSNVGTTQIYTQQILEDPQDPTGDLAAQALAPRPRRRRKKKEQPHQAKLL
jgi:integrase